jgi:uncharacterized protein (TIGR03083 family)
MTEAGLRRQVAAERREQADILATLTPEQWDHPTLCGGWRVREVIAHTTMPFRMSPPRFVFAMARSGGNFDRMADRTARRDAARMSTDELLACLRDNLDHPWTPPGGGVRGALSHDVIHGLDWTVGAGLDRLVPPERVAEVLAGLRPRNVRFFGAPLDGVELRATDIDFTYGEGTPVRGLAQDLLLAICGRKLPAGRLSGDEADRFTAA